jgi:hypothetical protein
MFCIKFSYEITGTCGGEYSITDNGSVRPKHVLIGFKK